MAGEHVADREGPAGASRTAICAPATRAAPGSATSVTLACIARQHHPCVGPAAPPVTEPRAAIYRNSRATGCARVVCYSPRHDLTLAQLPESEVLGLLQALQAQYRELGARDGVRHVLVFENKGDVVGVSNPHPHCQIYATNFVFRTIELEAEASAEYLGANDRVLFQDVIAAEEADGRRILASSGSALAFVPISRATL